MGWTKVGNIQGIPGIQGIQGTAGIVSAAGPGTVSAPSITFAADTNTGLYNPAPDQIGFSTGGVDRLILNANGATLTGLTLMGVGDELLSTYHSSTLDLRNGSYAAPVTTQTPTMKISRIEAIPSAVNPVDNAANAALVITSVGRPAGVMQPCAISVLAQGQGNIDTCAINATGQAQLGTGRAAAGYFAGQRDVDTASIHTLEIRCANNTPTIGPYLPGGVSDTVGVWLNAGGTSDSVEALAIGGVSGRRFQYGISFKSGSGPSVAAISDYSNANDSVYINGNHVNGLNLTGGTFTSAAMILPNNVPILWQGASAGTVSVKLDTADRLVFGAANSLFGPTLGLGATAATPDVFVVREAAQSLAQRNGTNPQQFRVYSTFTDFSNYERLVIFWQPSGDLYIRDEYLGTGARRSLQIEQFQTINFRTAGVATGWRINGAQIFLAEADNTCDIGQSTSSGRPRDLYLGGRVIAGGNPVFNGAAAVAKQTVSGSRGANAALASLLAALNTIGLVTDSSTA